MNKLQNLREQPRIQAETGAPMVQRSNLVGKMMATVGLTVAGTVLGCAATADGNREKGLADQIARLQEDITYCRDRALDENGGPGIVSFGRFGIKILKPGKPNYFSVSANYDVEVEQNLMIWPPAHTEAEIELSGDTASLSKVKMGTFWGVLYKSTVPKNKETLVIDVNGERYVIFVTRR